MLPLGKFSNDREPTSAVLGTNVPKIPNVPYLKELTALLRGG